MLALSLFSAVGIGLMISGYIVLGWALSLVSAVLTISVCLKDVRIAHPIELVVGVTILAVDLGVPFYIFFYPIHAESPPRLVVSETVLHFPETNDPAFQVGTAFVNKGGRPAQGLHEADQLSDFSGRIGATDEDTIVKHVVGMVPEPDPQSTNMLEPGQRVSWVSGPAGGEGVFPGDRFMFDVTEGRAIYGVIVVKYRDLDTHDVWITENCEFLDYRDWVLAEWRQQQPAPCLGHDNYTRRENSNDLNKR